MHIAEFSIEGFGIFHDVHARDLGPGITVFEGLNEAGKTTLMAYIRAILFGFEPRRGTANRYEPVRGGRHGGSLLLVTEDGKRYRVERVDAGGRGRVSVSAAFPFQRTIHGSDAPKHDEELLRKLLHGTSKILYQNVFAFGISELERLDTLQAEEVSSHIYTVGLGTGLVPLTAVLSGLDAEQAQLFKPGGRKPIVNQLLQRLDETQTLVRDLQNMPDEYYALRERLSVLEREITEYQGQLQEAKTRRDWLESLVRARPDWEQLQVVRRELQDLPHAGSFPAGGVERLEQLERALASVETRLDDTRRILDKAEESRRELRVNQQLLDHQTEIEALEDLRGHYKGVVESLVDLRSRAAFRRKALDEMLGRLGPTWNDARLDRFEATIPIRERIRGFRDELEERKQAYLETIRIQEDLEKTRREKEGALERLQEKLEELGSADFQDRPPLAEREQAIRQWFQTQHRFELTRQHRLDVDGQVTSLDNQIRIHRGDIDAVERQTIFPIWGLLLLTLVLGVPAGFAGMHQQVFLAIVFLTAGILGIGFLIWWRHEQQTNRRMRLDELRNQHKLLVDRYERLQEERLRGIREEENISSQLQLLSQQVLGNDAMSAESAESALRALEAERRLHERRADLGARIQDEEESLVQVLERFEAASKNRQQSEERLHEVEEGWISFLATLDLPSELTPDGALEVLSGAERAQGQLSEWHDVTQELHRLELQADEIAGRLNAVLEKCGWQPVSLVDASATLSSLRKALDATIRASLEHERLSQLIRDKQADLESAEAEKKRYVEQLHGLLQAGGATDSETFRRRALLYDRQVDLERQRRQLEVALRVHAGSGDRYRAMEQIFTTKSRAELDRELADATREGQQRIGDILTKHLQEKGRVEQQLQDVEQNERLATAMFEQQMLLAQLEQHVQRWAVRTMCRHVLDRARQIYERERQPAVLREASRFFQVMTEGRYVQIMVPLGEMRLEIVPAKGGSRTTEVLSRGTAEQLYLAMRLAFVREYAKHAGPLPLVVDDIFVNFDPGRAKATMKIFGEVARTHQILFFTCHPHVSRWFQETLPGIAVRPIPSTA